MPSFVSGNNSNTAAASKCAVECRTTSSASGFFAVNNWSEAGIEPAVAVHDKEARAEQRQGSAQGASRPQRQRAVVAVGDGEPEAAAIAGVVFDLLAEKAAAEDNLANAPGAPTSVVLASGSGQSATVATAFADPLVALVTDAYGNPVPGVSVTFAASSF